MKNEQVWRHAESIMARRERLRLIRRGTIRPAYAMQPQALVKKDDRWVPALRINGQDVA
jgi:hypothetical protein